MGGPSGNASTENMNGDAKPTNSKVSYCEGWLCTELFLISNKFPDNHDTRIII